jgi:F0F1-type ATP synthase assembly protein I
LDARDRTATFQRGLGDGFSLAVEFVVVPVIFALFGYWLDGRFGTSPILAVALGAFGFVGVLVRTYYAYLARSAFEEEGKPWTRSRR